ncbi:cytochrome P450 2D3-like [Hypanus sabinus]|uniref:cytochrome P450 2D3-like n=1 Tax=Hypanus sabinus TaxID=79690 RepID=UPI0028C3AC7B|nr:cytochrome P450 2D3-like [Hypanus sabinus]
MPASHCLLLTAYGPLALDNMEFSALPLPLFKLFDRFTALAVFCTVFCLVFDFMKRRKACGNYPPGPRGLPFVGNILQVDLSNPHLSFAKLWKKYGDVVSLEFGWTNLVVLSGYKTLKEALVKKSEDFADRPSFPIYEKFFQRSGEGEDMDVVQTSKYLNDRLVWSTNREAVYKKEHYMSSSTGSSFQVSNLIGTVFDLFAAGTETTSTTLRWGFLFMVLHPDIQFTDFPAGVSARLHISGSAGLLSEGTQIIPNLTSALFDEDLWSTPYQFNPGHFLNTEGKFVKPEAFITFSAGHRACLGEQLAKTELFIFFTSMLQRFTLFLPENEPRPSYKEARFGITLCPLPYRLCVKVR